MLTIVSLLDPFVWEGGWKGNHARNNHLSGINLPCGFELARTNHKAAGPAHQACAIIRIPYKDPLADWPLFL